MPPCGGSGRSQGATTVGAHQRLPELAVSVSGDESQTGGSTMRRTLVTAGSFVLLLGAATTSASAHEATGDDHGRSDDRTVILGGLDHPGQLSWDDDRLLVTDAGSGGNCTVPTTPPTGTTSAPAASDDGTADQGPGDTPATPTTSTAPITSTPPTGAT